MKPKQQTPLTVQQSREILSKATKEKDVVRLICEWAALHGYTVLRTSSVTATTADKGIGDLLVWHPRWMRSDWLTGPITGTGWMMVETKRPRGGRFTPSQKALIEAGLMVSAKTLDEFIEAVSR